MRISLQDILALYAAGQSSEQILADFPDLELEDLKAALDCFFGFKEANCGGFGCSPYIGPWVFTSQGEQPCFNNLNRQY